MIWAFAYGQVRRDFSTAMQIPLNAPRRCVWTLGGLILVIEGDLQLFSYTREPQEIAYGDGDRNKSWMARMLFGVSFIELNKAKESNHLNSRLL
jgi:hypothetical protein